MNFWVKLIKVLNTRDEDSRKSVQSNCTHVAGPFWLFEGDECALDPGTSFDIIDEQAIEAYGDLTGTELKNMVSASYILNESERLILKNA